MSYDLFFCVRAEQQFEPRIAIPFLTQKPHFELSHNDDSGFQVWYSNDATGVYFSFNYAPTEDEEEFPIDPAFRQTGLTFNLNYVRPTFFASEAMPHVVDLSSEFDLLLVNPQYDTGPTMIPRLYAVPELIESRKNWTQRTSLSPRFSCPDRGRGWACSCLG